MSNCAEDEMKRSAHKIVTPKGTEVKDIRMNTFE